MPYQEEREVEESIIAEWDIIFNQGNGSSNTPGKKILIEEIKNEVPLQSQNMEFNSRNVSEELRLSLDQRMQNMNFDDHHHDDIT